MQESHVNFKNEKQRNNVFNLFYLVLNGKINLDDLSVDKLKNNLDIEEIALFFELMSKHLNTKIYTKPESKQK